MVAVTATNDNDVRTFSGYGATTIDLGAPGESVFAQRLDGLRQRAERRSQAHVWQGRLPSCTVRLP